MAQTALTTTVLKQNNYAVLAGDLAINLVAMDAVNGNLYTATGREVLLFQNTDGASAHTITITSVALPNGRLDTSLVGYSIPINGIVAIEVSQLPGWVQAGGLQQIFLATNSALVKIAVLQFN